jgi:hypothetical protein
MLFRPSSSDGPGLAISQPAHAWLSGQMLRAWAQPLPEPLLLAADQHDVAWLDWELEPSFEPASGRPHRFRDVPAATHAPMWDRGVQRALAAWGRHAALLISRHGSLIYTRYLDRHRAGPADAAAADHYVAEHQAVQARWAVALGLSEQALTEQSQLIAAADALSLALCGDLPTPLEIAVPGGVLRLVAQDEAAFSVTPWPFRLPEFAVACEARVLPASGRFADHAACQAWLAAPERVAFQVRLHP